MVTEREFFLRIWPYRVLVVCGLLLGACRHPALEPPRVVRTPVTVSGCRLPALGLLPRQKKALLHLYRRAEEGWSREICQEIQPLLDEVEEERADPPDRCGYSDSDVIHHNAGIVFAWCGEFEKAEAQFRKVLEAGKLGLVEEKVTVATRVQLTLLRLRRDHDIDAALAELKRLQRSNFGAFISPDNFSVHGGLQVWRNSDASGSQCESDLHCGSLNLLRAYGSGGSPLPAFWNQLALYYLRAFHKGAFDDSLSAASFRAASHPGLDWVLDFVQDVVLRHGSYAPLHNTHGVILVEMAQYGPALQAFEKAMVLDPKLMAATLNHASLSLSLGSHEVAAEDYEAVLSQEPESYEALLGSALAMKQGLHSGLSPEVLETRSSAIEGALHRARDSAPERPEAYYNLARFFEQAARRVLGGATLPPPLKRHEAYHRSALTNYQTFIEKAGERSEFAATVAKAKERLEALGGGGDVFMRGPEAMTETLIPKPLRQ